MTAPGDDERFARTALSCMTDPGDPVLGALLRACSPAEVLAAVCAGQAPGLVRSYVRPAHQEVIVQRS